jgi:hypothetical protein
MKYIDTITPELRETKRLRCLEYNINNRAEINQKQKWTYYNSILGKDFVNDYRALYADEAKKYLREYVRLHPTPRTNY